MLTYRIKENRKTIAIVKIDDFLRVNCALTLLIGAWSVFAGLPPPACMRVHTSGTVLRAQPSLASILKAFVYRCVCWHREPFLLDLSACQRLIPRLWFHSYASEENLQNIENTLEQRWYLYIAPHTLLMSHCQHRVEEWRKQRLILLREHSSAQ